MNSALKAYPRTFWIVACTTAAIAALGVAMKSATVPLVALFMPSVFVITTLCEIATAVLLTLVLQRSHRWELQPLIVLFVANALFDAAVLLTIRLPGQPQSLIEPGNSASAWLFSGVHFALSICSVAYAAGRRQKLELSKAGTRQAVRFWFPAWTAVLLAGVITIIALCSPHGGAPLTERTAGAERVALFTMEFSASIVSIVLFVRLLAGTVYDWIDLSLLLTMIVGVAGLVTNAQPLPRYSPPWLVAQLLYGAGATFVLIAAIRDLLEGLGNRVRIESEALLLRADALEANAIVETSLLKSRFVAMVSHELRTPLGGIIGMAELLEREPLAERPARFTAAIRTSAIGLHRIVDDLLDFSRAESGRIEFEDAPFDLEETLDDIVVLFREQARERGVALNAFVDPALPRAVRGDQTRVKQVLQNLVSNALRFTNDGSVRIECVPAFGRDPGHHLQFSVSDTGIGIAPAAIDRIFDAFVQEDASTARRFGGTGLGLSISKRLVELMGGRISVWSVMGSGTTFSFTLPARNADEHAAQPQALPNIEILIYEEQADVRALLQRYADGWEMRTHAVASAADARAALVREREAGHTLDVLLIGGSVADADAADVLRVMRAAPAGDAARAIAIREANGSARPPALAGFDAVVSGPVRQSELFATILRTRRGSPPQRASLPAGGARPHPVRAERILVAEDNDVNQMLLAAQLEHLGFAPDLVADGEAALAAAIATQYDLIFMDCEMPVIDGFEATRRIRAADRIVPIVAVTAHVLPGYRETCLDAGMSDYLSKPALIGPLTAIIDRWLANDDARPPAAAPFAGKLDGAIAIGQMRDRLHDVFHGDRERIDRVIVMSLQALLDGARELERPLEAHETSEAGRIAHRLKGVALEIGSPEIAGIAHRIERAVQTVVWQDAESERRILVATVEATLPLDGVRT